MTDMKVELMAHSGNDLLVVNAARASFGKESSMEIIGWKEYDTEEGLPEAWAIMGLKEKDKKLLDYLAREKHVLPFRHPQVTLRCKAPIFLARQLGKHQVGMSWSEESRRYITTEPEFFWPSEWRTKPAGSVKQGSGTSTLPKPEYRHGFCLECGKDIHVYKGGQPKMYCSVECKTACTNKHRNPYASYFSSVKSRVSREGKHVWDLDFDSFEFPEYCKYLGIKLDYSVGKGKIQPNSPSMDRIDATKPYIKGNVEIISNRANSMKNDASVDEQIAMAKAILLRHKGIVVDESNSPEALAKKSASLYNSMLDEGYAAELARMILPQNMFVTWVWTGSLLSFYQLYKLRAEAHAQKEVRDFAEMIKAEVSKLYPESWAALERHV